MNAPQSAKPKHSNKKGKADTTKDKKGSLTVIGTGIRTVGQLTVEAIVWMEAADTLLYVVGDPIASKGKIPEEFLKEAGVPGFDCLGVLNLPVGDCPDQYG